jgi:serine/threonine protein kinase
MVIDFGIAKATNQRLTEKTLFTNYAQMIGTPAYMSPEQAEINRRNKRRTYFKTKADAKVLIIWQ